MLERGVYADYVFSSVTKNGVKNDPIIEQTTYSKVLLHNHRQHSKTDK